MDYCVQLSFENVNSPELGGYGVDHVKVAEGMGCKAIRVSEPDEILPALERAGELMREHRVPVIVEVILERVTNVAMGSEIDNIVEFEPVGEAAGDTFVSVGAVSVRTADWRADSADSSTTYA
jgi:tartronate-semialdehyde synthase